MLRNRNLDFRPERSNLFNRHTVPQRDPFILLHSMRLEPLHFSIQGELDSHGNISPFGKRKLLFYSVLLFTAFLCYQTSSQKTQCTKKAPNQQIFGHYMFTDSPYITKKLSGLDNPASQSQAFFWNVQSNRAILLGNETQLFSHFFNRRSFKDELRYWHNVPRWLRI